MSYLHNIGIALTRLGNTILGGQPGESISGRAWREDWIVRPVIDAMFFWEDRHCEESHKYDREHRDYVFKT